MRSSATRISSFLMLLLFLFIPLAASAECSVNEMTAVMILDNIYPGSNQALETLSVFPVGEHTFPSNEDLLSIVRDYVECPFVFYHQSESQYLHFQCVQENPEPSAILDTRTGQLSFLGMASSSSEGQVLVPPGSTHDWSMVAGAPTAGPIEIDVFRDSDLFPIITIPDLVNQVMAELLQTDVLHSFAQCGDYSVVIFPYTPKIDPIDPLLAKAVVMVNGSCGAPWNSQPVPVDSRSWGSVKSLYR
ncbi:MAG: hypothetical protein ABFS42_16175 [Candidatus Krumholzibacteriota bacterium]